MDPVTRQASKSSPPQQPPPPQQGVSSEKAARRDVRTRRTLSGDGTAVAAMTVFCPKTERSAALDACAVCERCRQIGAESSGREAFVLCAVSAGVHQEPASVGSSSLLSSGASHWSGSRRAVQITPDRVPVRAVMTPDVLCVTEDVSAESLMALLLDRRISGAPVVDAQGRPLGVVSKTDLVRDRYENGPSLELEYEQVRIGRARGHAFDLGEGFHTEHLAGKTVRDLMTPLALALPEAATVSRAAALMAHEGVHRIPIVSDDGVVVGILAAVDVLRWLATSSGYALGAQSAADKQGTSD